MSDWKKYFRIAHITDIIEAKKAKGGEPYGYLPLKKKAKKDTWLCRYNDYYWTCSDKDFHDLYCEVGKSTPQSKPKKQEDGYRKGKSRKKSISYQEDKDSLF